MFYYLKIENLENGFIFFTGVIVEYQKAIDELNIRLLEGKKVIILKGGRNE
jgi:hypothetical protein